MSRADMPTDRTNEQGDGSLGAGAEAVEGVHGAQQQGGTPGTGETAMDDARTGRDGGRAGSEPLQREREHESGYGGKGGAPRTSSDTREEVNPSPS